jgi:peptide/nickel transport system permease protein
LPQQYWTWLSRAVTGDLGYSMESTGTSGSLGGRAVSAYVTQGLAVTVPLSVLGTLLAVVIGVPLGVLAGSKRGSVRDGVLTNVSVVGISIPDFYLSFLLILLLTVKLGWLPSIGGDIDVFSRPVESLRSLALPVIAIGVINSAAIARMTRAALLESLVNEYTLVARARGLFESVVVLKHALRTALIPIVTIVGLQLGYLFGGVVVIETLFGLPGIGRQLLLATQQRDYPTIQALVLTFAALFIFVNLLVDLAYPLLDPRIRHQR